MARTYKCCGCKDRFNGDLMLTLPVGRFCSKDCAISYANTRQDKQRVAALKKQSAAASKEAKEARSKTRADKERIKTRPEWYDSLQTVVNQYALHVIGKGKPCCTCGKPRNSGVKFDAGHCRSRGACPDLRFSLTNIHPQCSVNCNQHGSGMRHEYKEFIVETYGQDHLDWLDGPHTSLKEKFPHYTDIKAEILRYRGLLRERGIKPNG